MTTPAEMHPLAEAYVQELQRAARRLPRAQRSELIAEIRAHLAETAPADASQAAVLTALDRLGEPAGILAEQGHDSAPPVRSLGFHEIAAILLLMFGGFLVFVGWLAGVLLLWTSGRWTLRDRLIGTFVIPGGYATAVYALLAVSSVQNCGGNPGHVNLYGRPDDARHHRTDRARGVRLRGAARCRLLPHNARPPVTRQRPPVATASAGCGAARSHEAATRRELAACDPGGRFGPRLDHQSVYPPSTTSTDPVTKLEASLAR